MKTRKMAVAAAMWPEKLFNGGLNVVKYWLAAIILQPMA
jgi:hypothetical protein